MGSPASGLMSDASRRTGPTVIEVGDVAFGVDIGDGMIGGQPVTGWAILANGGRHQLYFATQKISLVKDVEAVPVVLSRQTVLVFQHSWLFRAKKPWREKELELLQRAHRRHVEMGVSVVLRI